MTHMDPLEQKADYAKTPLEQYKNRCATTEDFNYLSNFPSTLKWI